MKNSDGSGRKNSKHRLQDAFLGNVLMSKIDITCSSCGNKLTAPLISLAAIEKFVCMECGSKEDLKTVDIDFGVLEVILQRLKSH